MEILRFPWGVLPTKNLHGRVRKFPTTTVRSHIVWYVYTVCLKCNIMKLMSCCVLQCMYVCCIYIYIYNNMIYTNICVYIATIYIYTCMCVCICMYKQWCLIVWLVLDGNHPIFLHQLGVLVGVLSGVMWDCQPAYQMLATWSSIHFFLKRYAARVEPHVRGSAPKFGSLFHFWGQ